MCTAHTQHNVHNIYMLYALVHARQFCLLVYVCSRFWWGMNWNSKYALVQHVRAAIWF